ncbi:MAG: phosphoribosyltransferase [Deltaproteobacteria bacterium]|nr:MAG: phosphoribosyltransferase [Deltaproteobacteria bacterium]
MNANLPENVIDLPELRDRVRVFRDRTHAGEVLASILEPHATIAPMVVAIPAGGAPVAKELAARLNLPLDIAVVSKITLPWNTEIGYGAVAFDGTVRLNRELVHRVGLTEEEIQQGIDLTSSKVMRRAKKLRGNRALPDFSFHPAILVDDGLASGFTMRVAVEALSKCGAADTIVAVPTGHLHTVERIAGEVKRLYCANIRGGRSFAVADAYQRWADVVEEELSLILANGPDKG